MRELRDFPICALCSRVKITKIEKYSFHFTISPSEFEAMMMMKIPSSVFQHFSTWWESKIFQIWNAIKEIKNSFNFLYNSNETKIFKRTRKSENRSQTSSAVSCECLWNVFDEIFSWITTRRKIWINQIELHMWILSLRQPTVSKSKQREIPSLSTMQSISCKLWTSPDDSERVLFINLTRFPLLFIIFLSLNYFFSQTNISCRSEPIYIASQSQ